MIKHSDDTEFNAISEFISLKREDVKENNETLHDVRCYNFCTVTFQN